MPPGRDWVRVRSTGRAVRRVRPAGSRGRAHVPCVCRASFKRHSGWHTVLLAQVLKLEDRGGLQLIPLPAQTVSRIWATCLAWREFQCEILLH